MSGVLQEAASHFNHAGVVARMRFSPMVEDKKLKHNPSERMGVLGPFIHK